MGCGQDTVTTLSIKCLILGDHIQCLMMKTKWTKNLFLPFCCFHVQGHQKPKLEKEKNSLRGKIPNLPAIYMHIFKYKLVILFVC